MSTCVEITCIPMRQNRIDPEGAVKVSEELHWYAFPREIEDKLSLILRESRYGASLDEAPDANAFLLDLEYSIRDSDTPFPWAIVFFPKEYALGGHLLFIRSNRDIRFSCYSLMDKVNAAAFDPANDGAPPMSIVYIFSKASILHRKVADSPIMKEACDALAGKPEDRRWAVIVDPIDENWAREAAKTNDEMYRKFSMPIDSD